MSRTVISFPEGVYTVLITPFTESNEVDFDKIGKWVKLQHTTNVAGLVLLGTTSESPCLNLKEQVEIVKYVYDLTRICESPKFVVVGLGGNCTGEVLKYAEILAPMCDGIMLTVPAYNKPTQEGLFLHYQKICTSEVIKHLPVIIYNVPTRTSLNMEPKTVKKIYDNITNVVGIKEASGNINQVMKIRNLVPELQVFSGDDMLTLPILALGGVGLISVASNIIPWVMTEIVDNCIDNNFSIAKTIFEESKLFDFIEELFCETNPIPAKFMMHMIGIYNNHFMREPLTMISDDKHTQIKKAMSNTINYMYKYYDYHDFDISDDERTNEYFKKFDA